MKNIRISAKKIIFIFIAFALVASFFLLNLQREELDNYDVPLVVVQTGATKVKPSDPGGVEFPNMDKSVYDYISPSKKQLSNVKIMPEPEQPMIKIRQRDQESIFASDASPMLVENEAQHEASIFSDSQKTLKDSQFDNSQRSGLNITVVDQPDDHLILADGNSKTKNQIRYKIEICTGKSKEQVQATWNKILQTHKDLLSNQQYFIEKYDLIDKAIVYKLQIGPFKNYNLANSLCTKLVKKRQACTVVSYPG